MTSGGLPERVDSRIARDQAVQEASLIAENEAAIQEADPYNQLVRLTAQEAQGLKDIIRLRRKQQLWGWKIGEVLLRRDRQSLELTFGDNGSDHPWAYDYWYGIETPIVDRTEDLEQGFAYGWAFELRHYPPHDAAYAYYSEKDANRPMQAWFSFADSPLYVYRKAESLDNPATQEKELWYTIHFSDKPWIISEAAANDTEQQEGVQGYWKALQEAHERIDAQFPELAEIRANHRTEGETQSDLELAGEVIDMTNFEVSERGRERDALIEQAIKDAGFDHIMRSGQEAVEHCLGLIRKAKAELRL